MPNAITTLVVVVQNAILLEGITLLVEAQQGILLLGSATTVEEGLALFTGKRPDCVLIDLDMPAEDSLSAVKSMATILPTATIIGLATYELDDCVSRAMAFGASAVVGKDQISQSLPDAICRRSRPPASRDVNAPEK